MDFVQEIRGKPIEELEQLHSKLSQEKITIQGQLDMAKSNARATGDYSDNEWFNKAQQALRIKNFQYSKVQE